MKKGCPKVSYGGDEQKVPFVSAADELPHPRIQGGGKTAAPTPARGIDTRVPLKKFNREIEKEINEEAVQE
jgi:hypothetical protein